MAANAIYAMNKSGHFILVTTTASLVTTHCTNFVQNYLNLCKTIHYILATLLPCPCHFLLKQLAFKVLVLNGGVMSAIMSGSRGKTSKNFKEDEHPNLLHCPFHNEGDNVLKHYMFDQKKFISSQHDGETLNHFSHQHPLILFDKQPSVGEKLVSLHDPMKRVQLLCDGCVKPIMTIPFYICFQCADEQCCFVLHEWCAKLPMEIEEYDGHPQHTLFLLLVFASTKFNRYLIVAYQLSDEMVLNPDVLAFAMKYRILD
ncbi:hypothetical protein E3N88_38389 [Mikania micrantha]|uniref:DC1 domain-containing protein n=1 Tax=Mikania micrantha TaxID=192012 RepID=A0A5N6LWE2_9ASTR|nr:hypothetical protein E3N88_38389 [Mikania micrantha]